MVGVHDVADDPAIEEREVGTVCLDHRLASIAQCRGPLNRLSQLAEIVGCRHADQQSPITSQYPRTL